MQNLSVYHVELVSWSEVTIRTVGKCCKDVKGHLRSVKCRDGSLYVESELWLARAGE